MLSIYVVNLDKDLERLSYISAELANRALPFKRVPAVWGRALTQQQKEFHCSSGRADLSLAEVGCMLSHIDAWRRFSEGSDDFALILEDDVHFSEGFSEFISEFPNFVRSDELAVHKLETLLASVTVTRRPAYSVGPVRAHELLTNHGGTAAYILSRTTASWLVENSNSMCLAVDSELFDPSRRNIPKIKVYQWISPLCIQDYLVGSKSFTSNIVDRLEYSALEAKSDKDPFLFLKSVFRPIYTLLYSCFLYPAGKARVTLLWKS
ncbi:glycosyltransferase family 25 protein [Microbulbifer sp. MCCC 1A16149]|uniref:glycosyltransferase family 25 protein n=1 Tax=Microbulbifer sp. MCCC 1A16149 TaxID=3411322 RepID=UPI003D118888